MDRDGEEEAVMRLPGLQVRGNHTHSDPSCLQKLGLPRVRRGANMTSLQSVLSVAEDESARRPRKYRLLKFVI